MTVTTVWLWTESDQDDHGDEYAVYYVAACDDDGNPAGTIFRCYSTGAALDLAEKLAGSRLEIINDMAY